MNAGIYREGDAVAGGLPLPRKDLQGLTLAIGALAFVAMILGPSLLAFAGTGAPGIATAWRMLKEGGVLFTFPVVLMGIGIPILLAVLGAFVVRGRKVPSVLLFIGAASPIAWGMFGHWLGLRATFGAISGESVDPEQKLRIMAEGAAEAMTNDIVSGFVACGCAIVACTAAASACASIDTAAASRAAKASNLGLAGGAVAGGLWVVASLVLCVLRLKAMGPLAFLPVLTVATIVPFAALAGRGAGALRSWHDAAEARRMLAAIAIAGLCAVLALIVLERGLQNAGLARGLSAISGESVDPSQQARILYEALETQRFGNLAFALHAVFGVVTFGAAMAPAFGGGRHPFTPNAIAGAVLGLGLVLGGFGIARGRATMSATIGRSAAASGPTGVELPSLSGEFSSRSDSPRYGNLRLVLAADGTDMEKTAERCPSTATSSYYAEIAPGFVVLADRTVKVAMLANAIKERGCDEPTLLFAARREPDPDAVKKLGDLSMFLRGTSYVQTRITIDPFTKRNDVVDIRSVADDAIEIDGERVAFPFAATTELPRPRGDSLRFAFRPMDTIERVVQVMAAVRSRFGFALARTSRIDIGMPERKPAPETTWSNGFGGGGTTKGPTLRQGALQVNGRLPPEVIQRIVRQNFGRFRLCYENGLRTNPTLEGRVTVKFVIDRQGSVMTAADGGSTLPDKAVAACVLRGFQGLTFPQPEGGIVTVVYPISFSPGD